MKQFLAIFTGTPDKMKTWHAMDEKTRQQREKDGMEAWTKWGAKYQNNVVMQGGPLGKTKLINPSGISDIKNTMAAYVVVQAESHEDAAKMFLEHPHFSIFPGDGVEVMECLPIPGR